MISSQILILAFSRPTAEWFLLGLLVAAFGEGIRIWSAGTIHKTEELTTGGPYAWVRHPLYVGSFFLALGDCIMAGRWEAYLVGMPIFLAVHLAAVTTEERALINIYGERYHEFSRRVGRFVPKSLPRGGEGRFEWAQVWRNKEQVNLFCALILIAGFAARLYLHGSH